MTCSERLQAELQEDPGGGPPLIPVDPLDPPSSPRDQDLAGGIEAKGALSKGNLAYHVVQTFRLLCSLVYCMSGCPCEAHAAICHGLSSVLCNVSIITPAQCLLSRTRIELSMNLRKVSQCPVWLAKILKATCQLCTLHWRPNVFGRLFSIVS